MQKKLGMVSRFNISYFPCFLCFPLNTAIYSESLQKTHHPSFDFQEKGHIFTLSMHKTLLPQGRTRKYKNAISNKCFNKTNRLCYTPKTKEFDDGSDKIIFSSQNMQIQKK